MAILGFIAYSIFCWWMIFRDGAEVIEGWKSAIFVDLFAATLTARELRFYVGIGWVFGLLALLVVLVGTD